MTARKLTGNDEHIYETFTAMSLRIQKLELALRFMAGYIDGMDSRLCGEDRELLQTELRAIGVIS